ncbi:Microtubule-associated protein futsch, partial [Frankliniella fusca]
HGDAVAGFLSWDSTDCHVDLEKELSTLSSLAPKGEESRNGERLVQYASESLVTEVLVHPQVNTLLQCVRNLLSSFTRHRHILHAGYTFAGTGSWILQDGTFSYADLSELFHEPDVQRVLRAYENSVSVDVHCCAEGPWRDASSSAQPFSRYCKVRVNPPDVLTAGSSSITRFIDYVSEFVQPAALESLLEPSDVVGNIRFSHPTLYVFPGGQGDAALFGINGFNMLVDGGFGRKSCFWDFARHLDRLDAVLLTRLNNANAHGLASLLRRKRNAHVYPQIGHFFCNLQDRKVLTSPDGDKDRDNLLVSLVEEGQEMVLNLRELHLKPSPCYRDSVVEPVNLYHKVGHGKLDMYVVSPARDSREVKEFLARWTANDAKLFASHLKKDPRDFQFPLQNMVSICALLVWQPANPQDNITRILFPGSTPQVKIFEGLDKIRHLEYLKHPRCTAKSLSPSPSIVGLSAKTQVRKYTPTVLDKITPGEQQKTYSRTVPTSETTKHHVLKTATIPIAGGVPDTKVYRATNTTTTSKSQVIIKKVEKVKTEPEKQERVEKDTVSSENKLEDNQHIKEEKIKETLRSRSKPRQTSHSKERKVVKSTEKKDGEKKEKKEEKTSPTTPKKSVDGKLNGVSTRSESTSRANGKTRRSPSATPAKSAKEANNRKVAESKTQSTRAASLSRASTAKAARKEEIIESTVKAKQAEKQIMGKRPKPVSPSKSARVQGSPAKTQSKIAGVKVTSRPSRAADKDVTAKKREPKDGKDKATAVTVTENALHSDLEQNNINNIDLKNVSVAIVDTNVTQEEKQDVPNIKNIIGPTKSITSEEDEKKSDGEMRSMEVDEEDDEYLVIEKEEPYTEESFQEQVSAESHLPVPLEDRGISDDDAEDEKLKRDTQESEKVRDVERPRKKSEARLTVQLTDKEHAEQIAKTSTMELEAAERKLSLKSTGKIMEDVISPGDKEKLFEEVQGIITSATELISKKEERTSPSEVGEVLKHADESKSEEKANDRIDDDLKVTEGKLSSEQKEESQPDEQMATTVESGATTAPTLPEDERIPLDNVKEVVEEKHVLEETKERETEAAKTNEALRETAPSSRPGHFHIQGAVPTLHRDIIKTPDEVADLPVDEEYDPSMYSKDDVIKSPSEEVSPRKLSVSGVMEEVTSVEKEGEAAHRDVVLLEIEELEQIKEMRQVLEDVAEASPQGQADSEANRPHIIDAYKIKSEPALGNLEGGLAKECRDEQEKDVDTKEVIDTAVPEASNETRKASATGLQVEERSDISVSLEELRILGHEVEDIKLFEVKREDAKYSDIEPRNLVEPDITTKETGGKPVTISILHVAESLASEMSAVEKDSSVLSVAGIPEPLEAVQEDVYLESSVEEEPIFGKTDAPTHPEYVTVTPDSSPEGPKSPSKKRKSVSGKDSRKSSAAGKEDLSKECRRESIRESEVIIGTGGRKSSIDDIGRGTSSSKADSRRSSTVEPTTVPVESTDEERRVSLSGPLIEEQDLSVTPIPASKEAGAAGGTCAIMGTPESSPLLKEDAEGKATEDHQTVTLIDLVLKDSSASEHKSDRPDTPGSRKSSVFVKEENMRTEEEAVVNEKRSDDKTETAPSPDASEKVCDHENVEIDKNLHKPSASDVLAEETPSTNEAEVAVAEEEVLKTDIELLPSLSKPLEKGSPPYSAESLPGSRTSPELSPSRVHIHAPNMPDNESKTSHSTSSTKQEVSEGQSLSDSVSTLTIEADAVKVRSDMSDVNLGESSVLTDGIPTDVLLSFPTFSNSVAPTKTVEVVADLVQSLSTLQSQDESQNAEALSRRSSAASSKSIALGKEDMPAVDSSSSGAREDSAPIRSNAASVHTTHSLTTSPTKSGTPSSEVTSRPTSAASNKSTTMETEVTTKFDSSSTGAQASAALVASSVGPLESVSPYSSPTKNESPTAEATSRPSSAASNKSTINESETISTVQSSSTEIYTENVCVEPCAVKSDFTRGATLSPTKSGSPPSEARSRPTSAASNKSVAEEMEVTFTEESISTGHQEDKTQVQFTTITVDSSQGEASSSLRSASLPAETASRPTSAAPNKSVTVETRRTSVVGSPPTSLQTETTVIPSTADVSKSSQGLTSSPVKAGSPLSESTSRPASPASNRSVASETTTALVQDSSSTCLLANNAVQAGSVSIEVSKVSEDGTALSPKKSGNTPAESTDRTTSAASSKSISNEIGAAEEVDSSVSGFQAKTVSVTRAAIAAVSPQSPNSSPAKSESPSAEATSRPTSAASIKGVTLETEAFSGGDWSSTVVSADTSLMQSTTLTASSTSQTTEHAEISLPQCEGVSQSIEEASNNSAGERRTSSPQKLSMVQEKQNADISPPVSTSSKESSLSTPVRKGSLGDAPDKQSEPTSISVVENKFGAKEEMAKPSDDSSGQRTSNTSVSDSLASTTTHTPLQPVSPISASPEPSVSVGSSIDHVKVENLMLTSTSGTDSVVAPDGSEDVTALSLKQQSFETNQTSRMVSDVSSCGMEVPTHVNLDTFSSESIVQHSLAERETAESTKLKKEAEDTEKGIAICPTNEISHEATIGKDFSADLGNNTHPDLTVNVGAPAVDDERRSGATTPSIFVTGCKTLARQSQPSESDSEMPEEDLQKRQDDVFELDPIEASASLRELSKDILHSERETDKSVIKEPKAIAETSILTTTQEFILSETHSHTDLNTHATDQSSIMGTSITVSSKDQQKLPDARSISDAVGISSTIFTEIAAVERAEAATSPMTPNAPGSRSETDAGKNEKDAVPSLSGIETTVFKVSSEGEKENLPTDTVDSSAEAGAVRVESKEALGAAKDAFETHDVSSRDEDLQSSIKKESNTTQQSVEDSQKSDIEHEEPEFTLVSKSVHEEYINVPSNENDGDCKKLAATTTVSTFTAKDLTDSPKHGDITKTVTTVTKVTKGDDGSDALETTTTEEVQTEGKVTSVTTKTESSPLHKRSGDSEVPAPATHDSSTHESKSSITKGNSTTSADSAGIILQSAVFNVIDGVASTARHVTDGFEDAMTAGLCVLTSAVGVRKDSLDAVRSCTPGSDIELEPSTPRSDVSSGQVSRAPTDYRIESEDEDIAGSPTSLTSQITNSPPPPHFDFDIGDPHRTVAGGLSGIRDDQCVLDSRTCSSQVRRQTIADPIMTSVHGGFSSDPLEELSERQVRETFSIQSSEDSAGASVPLTALRSTDVMTTSVIGSLTSADVAGFDQAVEEHRTARGSDLTRSTDNIQSSLKEVSTDPKAPVMTATASEAKEDRQPSAATDPTSATLDDPIKDWGKPLGLPSPAPPPTNSAEESAPSPKGTPQKDKLGSRKAVSDNKRRPESPRKSHRISKGNPIYIDLTYVPHHGNSYYASLEFFKRVRARYYVFSGIEPSREVYNALLEAKQSWEDKDLEVTIIPTYDTDTLGYWVAENEDALAKCKIDLSPSASRCTINLQDHETSCSAYRLEF